MDSATQNEAASPIWHPSLFPKQMEVFNARERFLLVTGPRISGKTHSKLHRVVRHAWEVKHARLAMFAKTVKTAKAAGPWAELVDLVIEEWLQSGLEGPFGKFEYTLQPKIDGATRMHYLRLRNYWGLESEIQLHSLKHDSQVEEKLLSTSFSLIDFSELQEFESPAIFSVTSAQLRKSGVPYDEHMWIADTNPPESGPDHFAYPLFFTDLERKDHPDPDYQRQFRRIDFQVDDNWNPDAQRVIQGLKNTYRDDPEGWQRFIEGKWTRSIGHAGKHFSLIFKKNIHVLGAASQEQDRSDMDMLLPSENCTQLFGGWDIGHTNNSMHIVERVWNAEGKSEWRVLDELVWVHEQVTVEEFGLAALERIEEIEKFIGKEIEWTHWSDPSAFRWNSHGMDEMDAAVIHRISDGRINFRWAAKAKAPATVRKRVEYIKQLLRDQRLFVSAHCFETIKMFQNIRKGMGHLGRHYYERDYIARGDDHKHAFDSLSYIIYSEMLEDLEETPNSTPSAGKRMISVPL